MLYHLHHICIRLHYNYCITCTSHFIYCLLSHNYIKHNTKNQSLYFTRVGWIVHRLTMMQWSNLTKCGLFFNIIDPFCPHTSSIGVAALEFPRYKALILILKKVLNCRYDLISGPILLPSVVFSFGGTENIQTAPNHENTMEGGQPVQSHSYAQHQLQPQTCV